jgi:hypothetical protein
MSIPAVGGGPAQGLQRALMEAAERALADEMGLLDGTPSGTASSASTANAARAARRQATARAATSDPALLEEAIVVELTEGESEALTVADGWITAARRGPLEVKGEPVPQTSTPAQSTQTGASAQAGQPTPASPTTAEPPPAQTAQTGQTAQAGQAAPAAPAPPTTPSQQSSAAATTPDPTPAPPGPSLERLILVLKKTGIDFRDAYQILRQIRGGEPLPSRAELRAQWQAADPGTWQERTAVAPERAAVPQAQPQPRPEELSVDDLIRDRAWHRAAAADPERAAGPSLHVVVREDLANQQYVAGLTTAEFQRLITVLGGVAPAWFWELRRHRGLRRLAERPAIARLNATRIAGTRLAAWILALLGMAVLWYVGIRSQIWW